jgi:histidine ammonia-lyase
MEKQKKFILIGPDHKLTIDKVYNLSINKDNNLKVKISNLSEKKIKESRLLLEKLSKDNVIYGVNTGFGAFKNKIITTEKIKELQINLIRSHCCGVGDYFSKEIVRAIMIIRLNSLCLGYSGVRIKLVELLRDMINENIIPLVPSKGSVGSSGDLSPLSHIALAMIGEGDVYYKNKLIPSLKALKLSGLKPLELKEKEGLALNNGTSAMTAVATIALYKSLKIINLSDMGCALTLEAICGSSNAFDSKIHKVRPHLGQNVSSKKILSFVKGSSLVDSIPTRIQDSYSLRCAPQVHGSVRDSLEYVKKVVEIEINSVTDNPLIFVEENKIISGGNFHGEPIAISMDLLGIAMSEIANISERRVAKLIDSSTNEGLPAFLIPEENSGLNSGLMIPQYTAAALVSENKVLAHPASVDSIPTSGNQEDHVSMGTIAARKALDIVKNSENVIAIEYLTALQAIDFRGHSKLGLKTKKIYQIVRKKVKFIDRDRNLSKDINLIREII